MPEQRSDLIAELHVLLDGLSQRLGTDAGPIGEADIIPDTGVLDSAGLLEFVVLIDEKYRLAIEPEDMTVDNLGSLGAIADFVIARRAAGRA